MCKVDKTQMRQKEIGASPFCSWFILGVIILFGGMLEAHAEETPAQSSEELVETTFEERRLVVPKGTSLTENEKQALWGKGTLGGGGMIGSQRAGPLFEGVAEQYLDAELRFAIPEGAMAAIPPQIITLAAKGGEIGINQIILESRKQSDSFGTPAFYLLSLADGIRLLVVRAAAKDPRVSLGALVCMDVAYERLKGIDRLPGEDDQLPLVAQQGTFSLQSFAYVSYQSGIKPGAVRVRLDTVVGLPPSVLRDDQAVGYNPRARLVYDPSRKAEPLLFGDSGIVEASSSYQITAHSWSGDELTKAVADSLVIRRITVDDDVRRGLQTMLGRNRRLRRPVECLFARWHHTEEVKRSVDKQGELHALVKRAGG